jgi:hypothetical protein
MGQVSKQVKGFLAVDGTFFADKPECQRYEFMKLIESLCESHGTNYENFMAVINAWDGQIKGYYDADEKCKVKQVGNKPLIFDDAVDGDTTADEPFLQSEGDTANAASGDRDAPGFLEQQIRKHI